MHVTTVRYRDDSSPRSLPSTLRCTLAPRDHKATPGWVDHLKMHGGKLYAHGPDQEPWPNPIVTLADCAPGSLVFLEYGKDAAGLPSWRLWTLVDPSESAATRAAAGAPAESADAGGAESAGAEPGGHATHALTQTSAT